VNLESISHRLFQSAFFCLALFIPFSIAGANFAIGFGLLAWMLATLSRRRNPNSATGPPRMRLAKDPLLLAVVLLVVSALPSVFMSEDFLRAFRDWGSYWLLLVYFLVAANLVSQRMREVAFWVLFASATASCLLAFVQRAGGIDFWFIHIGGEHRVSGTLHTMTYAAILYQVIILNFAVVLRKGFARRHSLILAIGLVAQFAAILLTMTRGAWLALIAGFVAVCVIVRSKTVLFVAAGLVVVVLVFSVVYSRDEGRNISIGALLKSSADRNVHTRLVLWDIAWDMFKTSPLLGVGMGDYTTEAESMLAGRDVRTTVDSHNVYLQILATRGLVGFLPFVFFWIVLTWSLFRTKELAKERSLDRHYAVGAIGVTVAILFGALTENNIDDAEVFIAYLFIIGLARSTHYREYL
jgi:O-antigen ligase